MFKVPVGESKPEFTGSWASGNLWIFNPTNPGFYRALNPGLMSFIFRHFKQKNDRILVKMSE